MVTLPSEYRYQIGDICGNPLPFRLASTAMIVCAAAVMAGCAAKRDSVIVGSIPDDYRTNHPIVISVAKLRMSWNQHAFFVAKDDEATIGL